MKTISENGFEFQGETKISDIFFQVIEYKLSASPSLETSVVYAKQLLLNFWQRANERWAGQMLLFCIYIYIHNWFFFYYLSIWKDCIRRVEKASWCSSLVGVNILKICALAEPSN